jgi:hypothetical protein
LENFFAKEPGSPTDYWIPEFMKFLVSQMADLKWRLLDRIVLPEDGISAVEPLSNQRIESNPMAVCQAVEDRICKQIDLTSRPDLDDRLVMGALRLLLKIVRRNGLAVDFSPSEVFILRHGIRHRSRTAITCLTKARTGLI